MALGFPGSTAKDGTPGPAVFPIGTAAILIVLSVLMILAGLKNKTTYFNFRQMDRDNKIALALSVACFILFSHSLELCPLHCGQLCNVLWTWRPLSDEAGRGYPAWRGFSARAPVFFTKVLMVMLDIAR